MTPQKIDEIINSKNKNGERISMCGGMYHSEMLFHYLEHIRNSNIKGDIVECGVWGGGVILAIMEYFSYYQMIDKKIWLYDTFKGLTEPDDVDYEIKNESGEFIENKGATNTKKFWETNKIDNDKNSWCLYELESVKSNLSISRYPKENLIFIVGDIRETLKDEKNVPEQISLLRLDTDWYDSTKIEMDILYPKVVNGGTVIVDDYNHWNGNRQAVDEVIDYKKFEHINNNSGPIGFIKSI